MSYREENGQVVLTMSREDYDSVLLLCGAGTSALAREHDHPVEYIVSRLALFNRLNQGNPNYTPYRVEETNDSR